MGNIMTKKKYYIELDWKYIGWIMFLVFMIFFSIWVLSNLNEMISEGYVIDPVGYNSCIVLLILSCCLLFNYLYEYIKEKVKIEEEQ